MKASVIIPVFNAADRIGRCVDAVKKQSVKPFEIILIDDGSSDDTWAALKKMRGVRLLRQPNQGPAKARNLGASKARGDILCFLDDDCLPASGWLKALLHPFKTKEVMGVQGAYKTRQQGLVARFVQRKNTHHYIGIRGAPVQDT